VRLVQEVALQAYPNPNRVGCPDAVVIHAIAIQEWPSEHPLFRSHICQCSPCIAAILEERTRFQADRKKHRQRVFMLSASAIVMASLLVVAFLLVDRQSKKHAINRPANTPVQHQRPAGALPGPGQPSPIPVEVALDIRSTSPTRSPGHNTAAVFTLPATFAKLRLTLPLGNDDGPYEIAIESPGGQKILSAQGNATTIAGSTVLQVVLDLSELPTGEYSLSYHHAKAAPHRISVFISK